MSCPEKDDMDIVIQTRFPPRANCSNISTILALPVDGVPDVNTTKTLGPQGFLRASHGVSRAPGNSENEIFYTHEKREAIKHRDYTGRYHALADENGVCG
jgi:hypothetical protein